MREFNINRPKRRSFNDWIADLQKLSGKRDVSQDYQKLLAGDPIHYGFDLAKGDDETCYVECVGGKITKVLYGDEARAAYALSEAAEGRWREDHPNDSTET